MDGLCLRLCSDEYKLSAPRGVDEAEKGVMRVRNILAGALGMAMLMGALFLQADEVTVAQTNTPTPVAEQPQGVPQIPMILAGRALGAAPDLSGPATLPRRAAPAPSASPRGR